MSTPQATAGIPVGLAAGVIFDEELRKENMKDRLLELSELGKNEAGNLIQYQLDLG